MSLTEGNPQNPANSLSSMVRCHPLRGAYLSRAGISMSRAPFMLHVQIRVVRPNASLQNTGRQQLGYGTHQGCTQA